MIKKSIYQKIVLAYIIFSFWGIFINKSTCSAFQNIFLISLFASVILVFILWRNKSLNSLKTIKFNQTILLYAIVSGFGGVFWLKSLSLIPVSQALFLFSSVPVFVLIVEVIFLKQKLKLITFLAVILGVLGIFTILSKELLSQEITLLSTGSLIVILASVMIALQVIFIKKISNNYRFEIIILILLLSQVIVSLFFAFQSPWNFNLYSITVTFIMSVLAYVIAGYFYVDALKFLRASTVRIIGYVEPLLGSLWGVILLGQPLALTTIIGGFFILFASYLVVKSSEIASSNV